MCVAGGRNLVPGFAGSSTHYLEILDKLTPLHRSENRQTPGFPYRTRLRAMQSNIWRPDETLQSCTPGGVMQKVLCTWFILGLLMEVLYPKVLKAHHMVSLTCDGLNITYSGRLIRGEHGRHVDYQLSRLTKFWDTPAS